jgi:shikimate kinase/3-dehydroquinate synthase
MTWRGRNIYLTGLPGAGKSAIGKEAARLLAEFDYSFIDLDDTIEAMTGSTVAQIFESSGEARFRELETTALLDISRDAFQKPKIVATGGGIVTSALNRSIMRGSGLVVWIDVNVRDAAQNVARDITNGKDRPLFRSMEASDLERKMRELYEARLPYYEEATLKFVNRTPASAEPRSPAELSTELMKALGEMSVHIGLTPPFETILANAARHDYPVHIGNGIAEREVSRWVLESGFTSIVIVTDENVGSLYSDRLSSALRAVPRNAPEVHCVSIESGEENKSFAQAEKLLSTLADLRVSRRTTVLVGLGGGVVTDITGFVASVYQRGLPLALVPTSLLAQLDAAIGGKTGVDAFGAKNAIGTFYSPDAVFVDPLYLRSLERREVHSGLAELVKYGLIGNSELWTRISATIGRLIKGLDPEYTGFISKAIREKLKYVESDEWERASGIRELLNFGHTFGHALESATGFAVYRHGEGVAIGIRTAAWLSQKLNLLSEREYTEIERVLCQIPVAASAQVDPGILQTALLHDKKRAQNNRFVLLTGIGCAVVMEVPDEHVTAALGYMCSIL